MSIASQPINTERRIYNLIKDKPDERDIVFKAEKLKVDKVVLPPSYDLRSTGCIPPILDQGTLGSCGPNQISNALRFCLKKLKAPADFQPSRLFIYYFTRLLEGSSLTEDTGISIRGGLRTLQKYGACSENNWGYNISKFKEKPTDSAIQAAQNHIQGFKYISVPQNLMNLKQALFGGFPIICGIQLYTSFESDRVKTSGIAPIPNPQKEALLGGHCVAIIGYDDVRKFFILANSWGNWGNKGYFTLSYDYIVNPKLASSFWIVTSFQ
jgi:C1A family cysteine protease